MKLKFTVAITVDVDRGIELYSEKKDFSYDSKMQKVDDIVASLKEDFAELLEDGDDEVISYTVATELITGEEEI